MVQRYVIHRLLGADLRNIKYKANSFSCMRGSLIPLSCWQHYHCISSVRLNAPYMTICLVMSLPTYHAYNVCKWFWPTQFILCDRNEFSDIICGFFPVTSGEWAPLAACMVALVLGCRMRLLVDEGRHAVYSKLLCSQHRQSSGIWFVWAKQKRSIACLALEPRWLPLLFVSCCGG